LEGRKIDLNSDNFFENPYFHLPFISINPL